MTSSVSFRITRTAEDLAQTITALSQRLVKLEQRQEALELQLRHQQQNLNAVPDEEISTLEGVEALLRETRELLESTVPMPISRTVRVPAGHVAGSSWPLMLTMPAPSKAPARGAAGMPLNRASSPMAVPASRYSASVAKEGIGLDRVMSA